MKRRKFFAENRPVRVKRSRTGLGLFAAEPIEKGVCIIEYTGRLISEHEQYTSRSRYLFTTKRNTVIDGNIPENTARYINHSCAPNCEVDTYRGRVFIFSKRRIQAGDELTYDYGEEYFQDYFAKTGCLCTKCDQVPA